MSSARRVLLLVVLVPPWQSVQQGAGGGSRVRSSTPRMSYRSSVSSFDTRRRSEPYSSDPAWYTYQRSHDGLLATTSRTNMLWLVVTVVIILVLSIRSLYVFLTPQAYDRPHAHERFFTIDEYLGSGNSTSDANCTASAHALTQGMAFPSGTWRGWYDQYGSRHTVCEFTLCFLAGGRITGRGNDGVGSYTIDGMYDAFSQRLAFAKQYIAGTGDPRENLGHVAHYRCERVGSSLGHGVKGTWWVRTPSYTGRGQFHLWPAMAGWRENDANVDEAIPATFAVTADNICCVCYDTSIDTIFVPCGHVAVCYACAGRLPRRRSGDQQCPICKVDIQHIRRMPAAAEATVAQTQSREELGTRNDDAHNRCRPLSASGQTYDEYRRQRRRLTY